MMDGGRLRLLASKVDQVLYRQTTSSHAKVLQVRSSNEGEVTGVYQPSFVRCLFLI